MKPTEVEVRGGVEHATFPVYDPASVLELRAATRGLLQLWNKSFTEGGVSIADMSAARQRAHTAIVACVPLSESHVQERLRKLVHPVQFAEDAPDACPPEDLVWQVLQQAADGLYNGFEPDNQSALWRRIDAVLKGKP
jgi:hypothetical protein